MGFDKAKAIRAAEKYLAQGKIPSAIQEYERIVEYEADDFSALNTLGDLYARVEKRLEAVACYRRVAEHYREQGFTFKAIAMYKKLSRFVPDEHKTALALASLYEQQGLMVEARQQYIFAADAYARAGETRQARARIRRGRGRRARRERHAGTRHARPFELHALLRRCSPQPSPRQHGRRGATALVGRGTRAHRPSGTVARRTRTGNPRAQSRTGRG